MKETKGTFYRDKKKISTISSQETRDIGHRKQSLNFQKSSKLNTEILFGLPGRLFILEWEAWGSIAVGGEMNRNLKIWQQQE